MKFRENHHEQKKKSLLCAMKSCMADGGGSSGDGLQEQSPNRLELHMLRVCVVSVREKVFLRGDQVRVKEMNESEPLDEMSKISIFSASKPER
jgi:hypothetical protein